MQKTHTHLEAPECFRHLYSSEKEREREREREREGERERERESVIVQVQVLSCTNAYMLCKHLLGSSKCEERGRYGFHCYSNRKLTQSVPYSSQPYMNYMCNPTHFQPTVLSSGLRTLPLTHHFHHIFYINSTPSPAYTDMYQFM